MQKTVKELAKADLAKYKGKGATKGTDVEAAEADTLKYVQLHPEEFFDPEGLVAAAYNQIKREESYKARDKDKEAQLLFEFSIRRKGWVVLNDGRNREWIAYEDMDPRIHPTMRINLLTKKKEEVNASLDEEISHMKRVKDEIPKKFKTVGNYIDFQIKTGWKK